MHLFTLIKYSSKKRNFDSSNTELWFSQTACWSTSLLHCIPRRKLKIPLSLNVHSM